MNINFSYDATKGVSSCIIVDKDKTFIGLALCHPDDMDFMSEKTGCNIAESKARIEMLKYKRDELKATIKTFKHFMSCIKNSKNYNPNSYETKMIRRQLRQLENQLATTKQEIATEKEALKEYIVLKDNFYKKIRKART